MVTFLAANIISVIYIRFELNNYKAMIFLYSHWILIEHCYVLPWKSIYALSLYISAAPVNKLMFYFIRFIHEKYIDSVVCWGYVIASVFFYHICFVCRQKLVLNVECIGILCRYKYTILNRNFSCWNFVFLLNVYILYIVDVYIYRYHPDNVIVLHFIKSFWDLELTLLLLLSYIIYVIPITIYHIYNI